MAKQKTIYCCSECGNETYNWAGKCPSCGSWNSLSELKIDSKAQQKGASAKYRSNNKPLPITQLDTEAELRIIDDMITR